MNKVLCCPHCNTYNEVPDDCYDQDVIYECTCEKCEINFGFTIEYYPSYTEVEVPCFNGADCEWVVTQVFPKPIKEKRYHCKYCDNTKEEILPLKEQIQNYIDYFDLKITVQEVLDSYNDEYLTNGFPSKELTDLFKFFKEELNDYSNTGL
jgi:transcription elongation factor Elf1